MQTGPFEIKDCALIALATGKRAQSIRELKDHLATISEDSIFYHFWGGLLRPRFDNPDYHNDFAIWSAYHLHDKVLAERLALVDPNDYKSPAGLRAELLEIMEERADELDYPVWSKRDEQFEFIQSQLITFNTNIRITKPEDFEIYIPRISVGSIFYHFIDARRRISNNIDDFQNWLNGFDGEFDDLCGQLHEIDPYFISLYQLRQELAGIFMDYFSGGAK
jgi:hypothetical protein